MQNTSINTMSLFDKDNSKIYYSISEVAKLFDVSTSLIRFWETEFDFLKPHKNGKGDRRFTKKNIEELQLIYSLVKERGFTLKGAKKEIAQNKERHLRRQKTIKSLQKIKSFLQDLKMDL